MLNIIFVDDEPNVLRGLKRILRPMRNDWNMVFCESADEALKSLSEQAFDVIVSDIRMPGMSGVQLLNQVKTEYPKIIRLALSGDAGSETELECAKAAHQFLSKPTDGDVLKSAISRAANLRDVVVDERVQAMIGSVDALPSLPELYQRVLEEAADPNGSVGKIGDIIGEDIAMTTKVLQLVNSAFFGIPRKIESVQHAASLLGIDVLKSLVLAQEVFQSFDEKDLGGLDLYNLTHHSNQVASLARTFAQEAGMPRKLCDDALMAGLMHNVGKLVLASSFPERYEVVTTGYANGIDFREAESKEFGITHEIVGGYLLGMWGLPNPIVEAISFHHSPSSSATAELSILSCLYLAVTLINADRRSKLDGELENFLDMGYLLEIYDEETLRKYIDILHKKNEETESS